MKIIEQELEPCPFCGSLVLDTSGWAVLCDDCGAYGPQSKSRTNALHLWNKRRARSSARTTASQAEAESASLTETICGKCASQE